MKHFVAYEQETNRLPSGNVSSVSSNLDDKTIHELYLWPFADAVHAGSGSVMGSYNRINNSFACENSKTLNGLLKTELGFEGFVVSDWTGQRKFHYLSRVKCNIEASVDSFQTLDLRLLRRAWIWPCQTHHFGGNLEAI